MRTERTFSGTRRNVARSTLVRSIVGKGGIWALPQQLEPRARQQLEPPHAWVREQTAGSAAASARCRLHWRGRRTLDGLGSTTRAGSRGRSLLLPAVGEGSEPERTDRRR